MALSNTDCRREIPLRTELSTKYGLKDDPKRESKEPLVKSEV